MKAYAYLGAFFALLGLFYWFYTAGYDKASLEYETMLRDAQNAQITATNEHQKAINAVTKLWLEKEPEIQVKYETIEKEVIKYVANNRACNLSNGAASLLNQAAKAEQLQADTNTPFPEAKKQAPSPVTQLESIETCIKWAEQYNELARRHDKLIEILD